MQAMRQEAILERRQAAYTWASSAGFSKTGMGAPKVMADLVESLAGAVFLDTDRWSLSPGCRLVGSAMCS